jgi:putative FmdB family regulatory protein
MPTYVYRCAKCGDDLEVYQTFSEEPLKRHSVCRGKLAKVLSPVGIVLKGSGFYKNDSGSGSRSKAREESSSNGDSSSSDSKSSESNGSDSKGSDSGSGAGDSSKSTAAHDKKSADKKNGEKKNGDSKNGAKKSPVKSA